MILISVMWRRAVEDTHLKTREKEFRIEAVMPIRYDPNIVMSAYMAPYELHVDERRKKSFCVHERAVVGGHGATQMFLKPV